MALTLVESTVSAGISTAAFQKRNKMFVPLKILPRDGTGTSKTKVPAVRHQDKYESQNK